MRGAVTAALLLAGCVSDEVALVESWVGVYRIEAFQLAEDPCDQPVEPSAPPTPFLVLDAQLWEDETRIRLRRCPSQDRCEPGAWWDVFVDDIGERRLVGSGRTARFLAGPELGSCTLSWTELTLTRRGDQELKAHIDSFLVEDAKVADAEACERLFESAVGQTECAARHQLEARRVQ